MTVIMISIPCVMKYSTKRSQKSCEKFCTANFKQVSCYALVHISPCVCELLGIVQAGWRARVLSASSIHYFVAVEQKAGRGKEKEQWEVYPPFTHTQTHTHTHTHTNIHKHACTHGCAHTPTHLPSPTNPILLSKLPLLSSLMKRWRVFHTCC